MPRSRATELPQRPAPRAPHVIRTSSSDSDPIHYRSRMTERSPKVSGGRSPRGAQSDPVNQRKLGSRIADLESQLGQAQEELKCLKGQLVSAEAAKMAAQQQLEKKSRKPKRAPTSNQESNNDEFDTSETDVFEVPVESETELEAKPEPEPESESDCSPFDEMEVLRRKLDEKAKELEAIRGENVKMKSKLYEKSLQIASAEAQIEELSLKLKQANQELQESEASAAHISEKLGEAEREKEKMENEMKMIRVQTEQWRKAADAAASVLAGEVEMNGRRISERCGSMDKHYGNAMEPVGGYLGSPGLAGDSDEGGKRKGSGIKMFGELWRKKGNK